MSDTQNGSARGVFVLGMHRSGTSAVTHAVKLLGFELGDNLMAAKPDNVKGFWEDWDVVRLNEQILVCETGSWDRQSLFDTKTFTAEELERFIREATALLQRKFSNVTRFAIKDPRISLAMPIWNEACKRQRIDTSYILCLRHPCSVAASLASRNEMPAKKALLLWLNHVYSILRDCPAPLLVVGYEKLLSEPDEELRRIAHFLGLTNTSAVADLAEQFLDKSLDHSRVDSLASCDWLALVDGFYQALSRHQDCPPLRPEQQTQLLKEFSLDDPLLIELNNAVSATHRGQLQQNTLQAVMEENRTLIRSLESIADRLPHLDTDGVRAAAQLTKLESELAAVKADRAAVDADRTRIDVERIKLLDISRTVTEDKRRIEQELSHAKEALEDLARIEAAKNTLQDALSNAKGEIASLKKSREQMSRELRELRLIRTSRLWRVLAPLRWMLNRLYQLPGVKFVTQHRRPKLQPINDLEQQSPQQWTAIGHDPQFLLSNIRYPLPPGSYQISLTVKADADLLKLCLYFDYGTGFREENSVALSIANRNAKARLTLTNTTYQLRLDPCESKGTFSIARIRWRPISRVEALVRLTQHIIRKNKARGLTLPEAIETGFKKARQEGWRNIWRNTDRYHSTQTMPSQDSITYDNWISTFERSYRTSRYGQAGRPVAKDALAVIVIDYEHDAEAVKRTLDSIGQQRTAFGPILLLSSLALADDSFSSQQLQHCPESNSYAAAVQGFVESLSKHHLVLVKAGNVFSPYFSQAVAMRLVSSPTTRLLYTDCDSFSPGMRREKPEFKPAWNPDLELAAHYVGDLFVISAELITQLPLDWLDHQQDALYSLLVRAVSLLDSKRVEHIPEVLWHKGGAAAVPVDLDSIQSILTGLNLSRPVTVVATQDNSRGYRLRYGLPEPEPAVDIIIPTKDQYRLLKLCIDSILTKTRYANYRIVVIDNGSTERRVLTYLAELRHRPQCSVLPYPHAFNYSAINNFAIKQSTADVVILMNNDIEVISPEWLPEMVSHAMRPEVGCVGAKLYYPDGHVQHGGVILGIHGVAAHGFRLAERDAKGYLERLQYAQNYSAVTGACLAVRRPLYQAVGGLNEQHLAMDFNDIDFCLKVREAGYHNVWTPCAQLYHHESATRGEHSNSDQLDGLKQEAAYMTQRWGELLLNDPAYNPNLTLSGTDFALSTRYVGGLSSRQTETAVNLSEHPYRVETNISRVNQVLRLPEQPSEAEREFTPGLSIVILTLDRLELIEPLLENLISAKRQLAENGNFDLQIVVGDTGSQDESVHALYKRLDGEITIVREMAYHFSRCNNQLFKDKVVHDAVLFLNNDIVFSDPVHTLRAMHTQLTSHEDTAIVGTYLLYPSKRLQHGGIALFDSGDLKGLCYHPGHNTDFSPPDDFLVADVPGVTGACLMMKSDQFVRCDYFDESYEDEAQDVDLCLKARRVGKAVQLIYCGEVIHYENATRPTGDANQRDRCRFIRKWKTYQEAIGFD